MKLVQGCFCADSCRSQSVLLSIRCLRASSKHAQIQRQNMRQPIWWNVDTKNLLDSVFGLSWAGAYFKFETNNVAMIVYFHGHYSNLFRIAKTVT